MSTTYEYSSYSSSSKGGADAGGVFEQADTNNDGVIDRSEFENLVGTSGSSSRELSKYSSSGVVSDTGLVGVSYKSSGYSSGTGLGGRYESSSYESTSGFDASTYNLAASYTSQTNASWCRYGAEVRAAGLYYDPHPEIIRRQIPGDVLTYRQNIQIRFLQPPPISSSSTLIIKEVRPAQPPALPPLRIRQEEQSVAKLPPLILRERPPQPPSQLASETIIRNLPALPVPPRSVIIERYPAGPAPPRDIIIERWLPYGASAERKTIVQRAAEAVSYPAPRNVIIQYERGQARIVRNFQNLGVTLEDPQAYIARYGAELFDAETLLYKARSFGVVEDISVPAAIAASGYKSLAYNSSGFIAGGEGSLGVGAIGDSSLYSHSTYESSSVGGAGGRLGTGFEDGFVRGVGSIEGVGLIEGGGGGYSSSTYKSSSYSSSGGVSSDVASGGFSTIEAKI